MFSVYANYKIWDYTSGAFEKLTDFHYPEAIRIYDFLQITYFQDF